jgi:hypothetical protein
MEEGVKKEKLVLPMEARNTTKDMFTEEEHWSQNGADAPGEMFGTTNTVNIDSLRGKRQQTHRMTAMHMSTYREDVKYKPNQEQNHGSMACHITKIINEGEIAQLDALYPMKQVHSDSKKKLTDNRMSTMNESTKTGDMGDKTYREEENCAKNVLLSAIHHQKDCKFDTTSLTMMTRTDTKEEVMNKIYQKHTMSAMYESIFQEDVDAKAYMKSGVVPGAVANISSSNDGPGDPQQTCMMGKTGTMEDIERLARPAITSERGRGGHN